MMTNNVVDINFYQADLLPDELADVAKKQGIKFQKGIMAVRTIDTSPQTYQFDYVGKEPEDLKTYLHRLAKEDGVDLNEAVKNMVKDEEEEDDETLEEKCAKKGHCNCWREQNASQCCWCGAFDEGRHKENVLKFLRKKLKQVYDKYPDEVSKICSEFSVSN